jgi:cAMP-dependent protein kinase regulator
MSTDQVSDDLMRDARPALVIGLQRQRNADGELILVNAEFTSYLTVGDDEAGALDLINGKRTLHEVVSDAIALATPLRPMATLSLVRRLHTAKLVTGLENASELFPAHNPNMGAKVGRLIRQLMTLSIPIPLLGAPLAIGKSIPRSLWPAATKSGIALFLLATLGTIVSGHLFELLDPFHGDHVVDRTVLLYISAAVLLTLRDGVRGLAFTSLGMPTPKASLNIVCGVVHLGIDSRQRRAAAASERTLLAWAGIAASCTFSAVTVGAWLIQGDDYPWLRALASTGLYLVVFNAAPYGRSDVWHLIGIKTRIPQMTERAAVFLFRRSLKNLMRNEPIRRAEETYLTMAGAWLTHWILSLWLVTGYLMPGALNALSSLARGHTRVNEIDHFSSALGVIIAIVLMAAIALLGLGLVAVIISAVLQILKPEKSTPPISSERIGDGAEALVEEMKRVPFLATLPDVELTNLIAGMLREKHSAGATVVRQGEQGDRFCFLHEGSCVVEFEEESGMVHKVATLKAGDFFGEIALLEEVPRTATVRTLTETEVYSLDRETFVALVERSSFAREAVLDQVRNAAFLRTVPVFQTLSARLMSTLLGGVDVVREDAGATIVQEGERGDAMYVIREGNCDVLRDRDGTEDHISTLGPGDWFGEIALLCGIKRTATVRTTANAVLVRVPGGVLDDVLLEDFQIGLSLERAMAQRLVALELR